MIPRYARPEMTAIWEPETRFRIWFEIEAHACDALAEIGVIPKEAAQAIWEKAGDVHFDAARIDEIEKVTKHDVVAFLTYLAEFIGPDSRFVHQGMTSSDLLDTCFAVQLSRASDILIADIDALLAALKRRAFEHKLTPTIGRSHGIHAEPTTFGLKLVQAYAEFSRARERLVHARKEIATCAISGAVGTYANVDPRVEAHVAEKLGLSVEPASTQIIPRDRHAMFFATLGVIASSMERLATEIRHLQRSEVFEAEEFFSEGQKGSSAMPHKRNPVLSENVTGLARLVRSMAVPAMENVALWHERDISHSSVERMIAPDATITLDFALARLADVIDKLIVYPDHMRQNLERLGGLIHSQRVLLALTQKGLSREDAYAIVQRNAMPVWRDEGDFLDLLKSDNEVGKALSGEELDELFDLGYHLKNIDVIFERVFGETRESPMQRDSHIQEEAGLPMSSNLIDFTQRALAKGVDREAIAKALRAAGWPKDEIAAALDAFAEVDFPLPVPKPKPHVSARETFVNLLLFLSLYVCLWAFLSVAFTFIDRFQLHPFRVTGNLFSLLQLEISTLVVFFPLFVLMFILGERSRADPTRHASRVRRWFVYLTLFAAAASLAGAVVALVYSFLSGEFATRFLLKILAIAIVASGLFAFFLHDVRKDERE